MKMRKRLLIFIGENAVNNTYLMSFVIIIMTLILGVMASRLQVSTSFTEMMPTGNAKAEEFEFILDEFNNASNIILLAEGEEHSLKDFALELKPRLEDLSHWVDRVDINIPVEFYQQHGLKLLKSNELKNFSSIYENPNLIPFLVNLNDSFEKEYQGDEALSTKRKELDAVRFLDGLEKFVEVQKLVFDGTPPINPGKVATDAILIGETYFMSPDHKLILIMIEPVFNMVDDFQIVTDAVDGIEKVIKDIALKYEVEAGLTGTLVLARDEMVAVESDSWRITSLALVGIFILFVASFRIWVSPLLAITAVIFGVIWAMGITSILVENLNMTTAMMGVILVGLGIDFSIHIISGYTEFRNAGADALTSMISALVKSGPGIITGGLTTALAFLTMIISENRGMREFGLVAGFGIVATMIASLIVLPVLLALRERLLNKFKRTSVPKDISFKFLADIAFHIYNHSLIYGVSLIIITGIMLFEAYQIKIDYNYLNMEPVGLESIKLQDKLVDAFDLSTDFVVFTSTDLDEVRLLTEKSGELSSVGHTESISDYIPDDKDSALRFRMIRDIRRTLLSTPVQTSISEMDVQQFLSEMKRLEYNIMELQSLAYMGGQDRIYEKAALLVGVVDDTTLTGKISGLIESIDNRDIKSELTYFTNQFTPHFRESVIEMTNADPLDISLLPEDIRKRFVGNSGETMLISIYPKKNIWEDAKFLFQFTKDVESISSKATGLPPIYVELLRLMAIDGKNATMFAIVAVFLLLTLDFRNIFYTLFAMVPLIFGTIWMVGIMKITGLQLTMMNIMAIPLIIGIGIDDGVHVLHRYRIEKDIRTVFRSTGKAIFLTSMTTMLGFGSLWFATYRGLGSMGIALFIGVGTCFIISIVALPVLFRVHNKFIS